MILSDSSPFYRLPVNLNPRQAVLTEGLRYSIDMIDLAHDRLRVAALEANAAHQANRPLGHRLFTSAFADAWAIIDNVHRLKKLLANFGYKADRNPAVRRILGDDEGVEAFRNAVQHMTGEINKVVQQQLPLWGQLSWILVTSTTTCCVQTMIAGSLKPGTHVVPNPLDYGTIQGPVAQFQLAAFGRRLSLSNVVDKVVQLARSFEEKMSAQFQDVPGTVATDSFVSLEMESCPNPQAE